LINIEKYRTVLRFLPRLVILYFSSFSFLLRTNSVCVCVCVLTINNDVVLSLLCHKRGCRVRLYCGVLGVLMELDSVIWRWWFYWVDNLYGSEGWRERAVGLNALTSKWDCVEVKECGLHLRLEIDCYFFIFSFFFSGKWINK
jgi:hypothetical protein